MTTPLGRVRGLGSAKTGTRDYVHKQVSGLLLALLTPWTVGILFYLIGMPRSFVVASLQSLWIGPPVLAFVLISLHHMRLGMQVIIEDYVHSEAGKTVLAVLNWIFCAGLALVSTFAFARILFERV